MPKTQYAEPEDSVRLYCEGFVGNVDLPDAVNKITWKKIGGNQTIESNENYRIEKIIREDNQVLGEILFIKHIKEMDFGQYMCSISNSDDQMLQQFINITKPVPNNTQSEKKVHRDLELIIFVMLALILIFWKRRWFYTEYQKLKKTFVNDKYALSKKTVHNVIVFYDEENKESAQYLVKNMENRDNYITKKCHIEFDEDFIKTHVDLIKGYDFAIYLLSSEDIIASSFMKKSTQKSLFQDNALPKKYIINCGNMPVTPTRSWCDRVLEDLSTEDNKRNDKTTANKRLIRIV
ncbi:Hypothetical protein CINCED_3A009218 [Cinara cedri]|nr:Hypothetical protein CINCED_3A009218 [Cinara cedri]